MLRVVQTDMTDELFEIAHHAMRGVAGPYGHCDFVNFILPAPMPYSWELPDSAEPMNETVVHGTVDTRPVTITPDHYMRQGYRQLSYPPYHKAYHITYGDHDFYFVPDALLIYVKLEKPDGG